MSMANPKGIGSPSDTYVRTSLAMLETLPLPRLRAFWQERWGEPPAYRTRDQMVRAAAWKLQADAFGGFTAKIRNDLRDLGERFAADRTFSPVSAASLMPGTTLLREWGGKRHEVAVVEEGFLYDGKPFKSLSAVALAITGTQWNGLVFFGVKPRRAKAKVKGGVQ